MSDALDPVLTADGRGPLPRALWGAFIGGQWVLPDNADRFAVLEPATGGHLAEVMAADENLWTEPSGTPAPPTKASGDG